MRHPAITAVCWAAIAFSLVYLLAGHRGGIVFQNPLAAAGTALIGLGLIKRFGTPPPNAPGGPTGPNGPRKRRVETT